MRLLTSLGVLSLSAAQTLAAYNLVQSFSGSNFFQGWDFFDGFDNTTNGDVNFLSEANATASKLTFVNDAGRAVIKVDNTTFVPFNFKRNSVKINTHDFFSIGSVFVLDAVHIPFGCSVWPSFWTKGPNWPAGGEIDIMELVNLAADNQMTLHATAGCTQPANVMQLGKTSGTDCSQGVNSSIGCTVIESQPNNAGADFASAGGGVWAAQFDVSGIFVWFWSRNSIPADISNSSTSVDPSTWGTPSASWPASTCNVTNFFTPQQLVLDITLCGDFAGQPTIYAQTCGGPVGNSSTCYLENVINNGTSQYADAFFEINYVKAYSLGDALDPTESGSSLVLSSVAPTVTSGGNGASSSTGTNGATGLVGGTNSHVAVLGAMFWAVLALFMI
ncbi:concanavalin A-like lectin/glucanase domain-containing protein [Ganoderma leucocontextum]|nr:concanavalin A-like lectin/glucanase domain-containing protein [Ganoderma leucocontextum]